MITYTLIVALFTGHPVGLAFYPQRVETYMEKNYSTHDACVRAAAPYDAFSKLKLPRGSISVSWECVPVGR